MHDDKRDQFVDELLEASLKQYRGEEPRSGLEMQILAGIRTWQRAARRRRLVWAMALCAGMLAAIGLVLHSAHAPSRQRVTSASGAHRAPLQAAKPPASPGSADSRLGSPRLVQRRVKERRTTTPGDRAAWPSGPEQFPTPMPLTEQEKLLLAYVSKVTKPESAVETNEKDEAPITELRIPAIKIAPLEIKPLDDSQSEQEK